MIMMMMMMDDPRYDQFATYIAGPNPCYSSCIIIIIYLKKKKKKTYLRTESVLLLFKKNWTA
jgi:hypothetical protein